MTDPQPAQTTFAESPMPDDTRAVFTSPMIFRKRRLSMLIKWFMQNWHAWYDEELTALPARREMSIADFADGLTLSLKPYNIRIHRQRVWTWLSERNLPRDDNFHVMTEIATGWQKEFADLVLEILNGEVDYRSAYFELPKPELPKRQVSKNLPTAEAIPDVAASDSTTS